MKNGRIAHMRALITAYCKAYHKNHESEKKTAMCERYVLHKDDVKAYYEGRKDEILPMLKLQKIINEPNHYFHLKN